ncbi:dirigent protein 22-like [Punica granatum]|uniref:Dirigent protein n=2 Tax=Punica granatum TaxID=22663 RepID=A0A218VQT7_PUNGR|nr:dirigent protein 22-like [Punica granatum]OWM62865.1 hypothetical protein CDL15_Pgr020159 [Punica granatum]PKI48153.1 hypothetical protein CRG98_031418 [Punica granatum]
MAEVASVHILSSTFIVFSLLFSSCFLASEAVSKAGDEETHDVFGRTLDPNQMGLKKEKLSHFRFFWHDIVSGKNPSSIEVIRSPIKNSSLLLGFGLVHMFDNRLTISGDINSKLVGRAQGFYAQADMDELALLVAQNFLFLEGKYNGSTITVLGRNQILNTVRELPIVGGSGAFRFARGYIQARTYSFDLNTLDATVEYNVYVLHY